MRNDYGKIIRAWLRECRKKNKTNIILGRGVSLRGEIFKLCKIEKERNHTTQKRVTSITGGGVPRDPPTQTKNNNNETPRQNT